MMEVADKFEEPVRVIVRLRPKIEDLPQHNLYKEAVKRRGHNTECIAVMDTNTLKIIPNALCQCKDCTKRLSAENKLDRAATGRGKKDKYFRFDRVFNKETTQEQIYESISDLVLNCIQGYACCIFTYGPSSTGKTFTLAGNKGTTQGNDVGIIPRVIEDTFQIIENTKAQDLEVFFHVELSYVELYNNNFKNLLKRISDELTKIEAAGGSLTDPTDLEEELIDGIIESEEFSMVEAGKIPDLSHNTDKIALHESPLLGVFLSGHNLRIPVRSVADAIKYYKMGNKIRRIGTGIHEKSYRSHAILTLYVESKLTLVDSDEEATMKILPGLSRSSSRIGKSLDEMDEFAEQNFLAPDGSGEKYDIRLGKIHLVDLVGGERLSESNVVGVAAQETQYINKSLLALGEVLHSLAANAGAASAFHVPYYNSKLTHFLKDALGGNSKTTIFCNIGSEADTYNITLYALMFAARALKVRNMAGTNRVVIEAEDVEDEHELIRQISKRIMATASSTPLKDKKGKFAALGRTKPALSKPPAPKSTPSKTVPKLSSTGGDASSRWGKLKAATTVMSLTKSGSISRSASSVGSTARGTKKILTLRLHTVIAQDLKYVTFPLAPIILIRVGKHKIETPRRIYRRSSAQYIDEYEIPLDPSDFKDGREMEVAAVNVNTFGYSALIGEGRIELQSVLSPKPTDSELEDTVIIVPLKDETPHSCGRVVMNASVLERAPNPALLAKQAKLAQKKDKPSSLKSDDDDEKSVTSQGSRGSQSSKSRGSITPKGSKAGNKPIAESKLPEKVTTAILTVKSVICIDLPVAQSLSRSSSGSDVKAMSTLQLPEYAVSVQVGKERRRTRKVPGKHRPKACIPFKLPSHGASSNDSSTNAPTAFVCFDKPEISFVVDPEQIHWDSLQVTVFEGEAQADDHPYYVGKASGQLLPLQGMLNNESEGDQNGSTEHKFATPKAATATIDEKEFALQLKDIDHHPAGKIVLLLHMSKIKSLTDATLASANQIGTPSKSPRLLKELACSPRLNNVRVPKDFKNGWVRIHAIAGIGLNKFNLVGKRERHKHIRDQPFSPVPKQLKQSDILGLQDPFVVVEVGDFWTSYTKVLLDQSWDCQWDKLEFSCYVTGDDASTKDMKLTVYDRRYGNTDSYIGTCVIPLVNLYANPLKTDSITEVPVLDRKGKYNGKLAVSTICTGTEDGGERWSHATVTAVHGFGRYDVVYDDGQEEPDVHKDFIRLIPPNLAGASGGIVTPLRPKKNSVSITSTQPRFKAGDKVEVNNQQGRGVWLPATVVKDNEDGTYDIESDYAMEKVNVSEADIRDASNTSGTTSPKPGMLSRRTSKQGVDPEGSNVKGRYSMREKVLGNYKSKGTWYPGTIWKIHSHDNYCTYDIDYEMGEIEKDVPDELIRPDTGKTGPSRGISKQISAGIAASGKSGVNHPKSSVITPGKGLMSREPSHALQTPDDRAKLTGSRGISTTEGFADQDGVAVHSHSKFSIGDKVAVNYRGHGTFLPATIEADYQNGYYDVVYDTQENDNEVPEDLIRLMSDMDPAYAGPARDKFAVGDKVTANYREIGKWLPGTITRDRGHGVYDIHYNEGRNETKVAMENIKLVAANPHKPTKKTRFEVHQCVEVNTEGLGQYFPAIITKVVDIGIYDVEYVDGTFDYDIDDSLLRAGGAYTPALPCSKPVFKVGDRVRISCRAPAVEKELRNLSAIKQRIAEERAKLATEKSKSDEQRKLLEKRNAEADSEEEEFKVFMKRVDQAQEKYMAEHGSIDAKRRSNSMSSPRSSRPVSPRASFNNGTNGIKLGAYGDLSIDAKEPATIVGKATAVEVSLARMSARGKEREQDLADQARLAYTTGEAKADKLAQDRDKDESKARRRGDNPELEIEVFKAAYEKAEKELAAIMAAREKAIDETLSLGKANGKADNEVKCYNSARRKGELALAKVVAHLDDDKNRKAYRKSTDDAERASEDKQITPVGKGYRRTQSALLKVALATKSADPEATADRPQRQDSLGSIATEQSSTVDMEDIYARTDSNFGEVRDSDDPQMNDIYGTPAKSSSVPIDPATGYDFDFQNDEKNGNMPSVDVNAISLDDLYDAIFLAALGDEDAPLEQSEDALGYDVYDTTGVSPAPAQAIKKKGAVGNDGKELSPRMQLKLQVAAVEDAQNNLDEAIARAEKAKADYQLANAYAMKKMGEVDIVLFAVSKNERNINSESKASPSYEDFQVAQKDANMKKSETDEYAQSKDNEVTKAESIQQMRETEANTAQALHLKKTADDSKARGAMINHDPQAALKAVQEAKKHVDKEIETIEAAMKHCHDEAAAYMSARVFAEQQHKAAKELFKRGTECAMALHVVKNEQKERDLQKLRDAKLAADNADTELDREKELSTMKRDELKLTHEQIAAAMEAIAAIEKSFDESEDKNNGQKRASVSFATPNGDNKKNNNDRGKERNELKKKIEAIRKSRLEHEKDAEKTSKQRESIEEHAKKAEDCCIEEEEKMEIAAEKSNPLINY